MTNNELICAVARDLMPQYAEGLLSAESEAALRAHMDACADCRAVFAQITAPEPAAPGETKAFDYMKKEKKNRARVILCACLALALLAAGLTAFFVRQSKKAGVTYDAASGTVVVYGKNDDAEVRLPEAIDEAQNLDAQFSSFHVTAHLPLLRTDGVPLNEYLPAYLSRTGESLRFLRGYLREHCADAYPADRADKYVELSITPVENYTFTEHEDRISLEMGSFYWHREELYVLALLGNPGVEWKELGYAWYLGVCIDPYSETLLLTDFAAIAEEPYCDAYRRGGGTAEKTTENQRRLIDAVAYTYVTKGTDWGTAYESRPLKKTALYVGPQKTLDPGNDMSVTTAAAFIARLADTYGFDSVSAFCFGQKSFEEAFGVDYATAYHDWTQWLTETYGE